MWKSRFNFKFCGVVRVLCIGYDPRTTALNYTAQWSKNLKSLSNLLPRVLLQLLMSFNHRNLLKISTIKRARTLLLYYNGHISHALLYSDKSRDGGELAKILGYSIMRLSMSVRSFIFFFKVVRFIIDINWF